MTTEKQILANRQNAQKSTGPRSVQGKEKVSGNRIAHGILSSKLLLTGEDPDEYQSLLDALQGQLRPSGALELGLVEKIAVIYWRQRRLVGAETATIELAINPKQIASEVGAAMGLSGFGSQKIEPADLHPLNQEQSEQLAWCKAVIAECDAADALSLDSLSTAAPLVYAQLVEDAEAEEETIAEHLADTSLDEYVSDLIGWCENEIVDLEKKMERYPVLAALSEKAKEKLCVPWQKLDVLAKYQAALDNQLYKAMKALREAQEWRMTSIDATEPTGEDIPADAA
jgi:hypothetical protein